MNKYMMLANVLGLLCFLNIPSAFSHCEGNLSHCAICSHTTLNCTGVNSDGHPGFEALQKYGNEEPDLELVIFKGHNIRELGKNALGNVSHDSLSKLVLSNNNIERIDPGAFHHMKNLKELNLDNNEWDFNKNVEHPRVFNHTNFTTLSLSNAFATPTKDGKYTSEVLNLLKGIFVNSSMHTLKNLSMSRNSLHGLPSDFFDGMPNLEYLDLSHNSLYSINFPLGNLTKLHTLRLDWNYMEKIERSLMDDISHLYAGGQLKSVMLSRNPINCDCEAVELWHWLQTENSTVITDLDRLMCTDASSDDMVGKSVVKVDVADLVCKESKKDPSYLVLGIVMGLVGVVAFIILIMNRSIFINKYRSCKETMGSKHEFSVYSSARYSSVR